MEYAVSLACGGYSDYSFSLTNQFNILTTPELHQGRT